MDIEIDKWISRYFAAEGSKNPAALKQKLDTIVKGEMCKGAAAAVDKIIADDGRLVFIDRIKFNFHIDMRRHDDLQVSAMWGREMAYAIVKAMKNTGVAEGADAGNVKSFTNNSEYVTCFIIDLLGGAAKGKWYYRTLHHFCTSDFGKSVRELLRQNIKDAESTLLLLKKKGWMGKLLEELNEKDAAVIYEECVGLGSAEEDFKELLDIVNSVYADSMSGVHVQSILPYKSSLAFYLETIRRFPALRQSKQLKKIIHAAVLSGKYDDVSGEVVNSVRSAGKLWHCHKFATSHGGMFFLIRTVLDMNLFKVMQTAAYPDIGSIQAFKIFLFFLAQRFAGCKAIAYESSDPAIFCFAGLEASPTRGHLEEFVKAATSERNERFLKALLAVCPEKLKEAEIKVVTEQATVDLEEVLSITSRLICRSFASSLKRFENVKEEYVLLNFIYRESEIIFDDNCIFLNLSEKPLDIVLRFSGVLSDIRRVSWLDDKDVRFVLEAY